MTDKGLIVSLSGPSGVCKGTVLAGVREKLPDSGTSVSVTTRKPREGEAEGVSYFFRTKEEFLKLIDEGEILEYDTYVEQAVTIFILPPSYEALRTRLVGRGTETEDVIEKRLAEAQSEIVRANEFDYVVVNDDLEDAIHKVLSIIEAEKCRYEHNNGIEKKTSWT